MRHYVEPNIKNWLKTFWLKEKLGFLLFLVFFTCVYTALSISYPIFFKLIVDGINEGQKFSSLRKYVLYLFLFGFGSGLINWLLMSTRGFINMSIERKLRNKLYESVMTQSGKFFQKFGSGDLITRLVDDVGEKFSWMACSGVFRAVQGLSLFVFVILMMMKLHFGLALISIIPIPIIIYMFTKNEKKFEKKFRNLQESISSMVDFVEASFSGIRVIKAFNRDIFIKESFAKFTENRILAENESVKMNAFYKASNGIIEQLGIIAVLLFGGIFVIQGKMSLGSFVAFNTYNLMLIEPIWNMSFFFISAKRASVSLTRMQEIWEYKPEISDSSNPKKFIFNNKIEFKNVSFSYGDKKVLENLSFEVLKGQKVAITGQIGTGKSTLCYLLLRLFDVNSGSINIDGEAITEISLEDLRKNIGYAPQEALLFSDSILNNIHFYRENIDLSKEHLDKILGISELNKEISKFDMGMDTKLGQRGLSLSGGQKQRVSLARALIANPQILILDDITSAIDAETEKKIWEQIDKNYKNMTIFIVTHRLSTIQMADKIITL